MKVKKCCYKEKSRWLVKFVNYTVLVMCSIVIFFLEITPEKNFNYFTVMNQPYLDFSDLDVRDSYNRTVSDIKSKESLRNLFVSTLYTLLVKTEIHSILNVLKLIERQLNLASLYFARRLNKLFMKIGQIGILIIRRLSWIFVFIGLVSLQLTNKIYPLFFSYLFFSPKSKVAPLVLRC